MRVLIVEDEILTAMSLRLDIEDLGAETLEPVTKGEDAVEIALQENPDLILMDIRLAGVMDGIEAAEKILKIKKISILFMTGYAIEDIKERTKIFDHLGFLAKPVDINKIKKIMNTYNYR